MSSQNDNPVLRGRQSHHVCVHLWRGRASLAFALTILGCGSSNAAGPPGGSIYFMSGQDTDTWKVTTKPLRISGKQLELNADASAGPVLVEVLDETGSPLRNFQAADCRQVGKDGLNQKVSWKREKNLASLDGKTVSLRFVLKPGAKLYAYRVTN